MNWLNPNSTERANTALGLEPTTTRRRGSAPNDGVKLQQAGVNLQQGGVKLQLLMMVLSFLTTKSRAVFR
jgi:hypothetical protein